MNGKSSAGDVPVGAPALEVDQIAKNFGGIKVFEGITFKIFPGEVLGVIGPNGAGKTTLINVISGQLQPSTGKISLLGKDVTALPLHSRAKLGLVRSFQQTKTFKSATVRENVARAFVFSGRKDSSAVESVEYLIERFDLLRQLDLQADKLPYGQQKMLGLLMTFVAQPKVLLLDEPAAGLESSERDRIDLFVHEATSRLSCGVLLVEHDMDLVKRLCTRLLVLDGGRLLAEGTPSEVLTRKEVIEAYLGVAEEELPC